MRNPFARIPADVAAAAPAGERVLSWSRSDPSGVALATKIRFIDTASGLDAPWVEILGAAWDDPVLEFTLWRPGEAGTQRCRLVDAGVLPQVVRERIMQSLLLQQHVPISGAAGVRFLARRDPSTDVVFWQKVVDPGVDVTDPDVAERLATAQADLERVWGVGG